jgi:hypothetical protein
VLDVNILSSYFDFEYLCFIGINYEIFDLIKLIKYLNACDVHPNYDGDNIYA